MQTLTELLADIAENVEFFSVIEDNDHDNIRRISDEYFVTFRMYYEQNNRHQYSEIAEYVCSLTGDMMDHLKRGIEYILSSARENHYNDDEETSFNRQCYDRIVKLYDHLKLEILHESRHQKIKVLSDNFEKQKNDIEKLLKAANVTVKNADKAVEDAEMHAKKLSEQLISILGIFAGIVVTFSFATTTIGEAMANLTQLNASYLGFIIFILGFVFINVIALLMTFVFKLSGRRVSSKFPWLLYFVANLFLGGMAIWMYINNGF